MSPSHLNILACFRGRNNTLVTTTHLSVWYCSYRPSVKGILLVLIEIEATVKNISCIMGIVAVLFSIFLVPSYIAKQKVITTDWSSLLLTQTEVFLVWSYCVRNHSSWRKLKHVWTDEHKPFLMWMGKKCWKQPDECHNGSWFVQNYNTFSACHVVLNRILFYRMT